MTGILEQRHTILLLLVALILGGIALATLGGSDQLSLPGFDIGGQTEPQEPCPEGSVLDDIRRQGNKFMNGQRGNKVRYSTEIYEIELRRLNYSLEATNSTDIWDIVNALKSIVVRCDGKW
jgi:hypothetical protein